MNRLPVRKVQAKGRNLFQLRTAGWEGELATMTRVLGDGAVAAEERTKIEKIMDHAGLGAGAFHAVHRVSGFGIGMVEPRREYREAPQIAALLVRDQVIGVVAPDSLIQMWPH